MGIAALVLTLIALIALSAWGCVITAGLRDAATPTRGRCYRLIGTALFASDRPVAKGG